LQIARRFCIPSTGEIEKICPTRTNTHRRTQKAKMGLEHQVEGAQFTQHAGDNYSREFVAVRQGLQIAHRFFIPSTPS
jgi:hypothetical protein